MLRSFKNFREFTDVFSTEDECLQYLCELKWGNGFSCRRCEHKKCTKGRKWYYRRCQKCRFDESCTSNTLFHKLKFSVVSAFWICYQMSNHKKGMSTLEISRQYGIHQETAWYFKRKVQYAMNKSSQIDFLMDIQITPERSDNDVLEKELISVSSRHLHSSSISLKVKKIKSKGNMMNKSTFSGVKLSFNGLKQCESAEYNWYLFNLKKWIGGIHHHISLEHLPSYLEEFNYRFNARARLSRSPGYLIHDMVKSEKVSFSSVKAN
jgi:hypothetical protein